jgi:3-phenylpropionate/trans-cinnamate dioxygenase ferredoxin reductase subunit
MRRIVIIGAGQAGRRCAEMIRELDAAAEIMVFGAEAHLPYDRPPLSKSLLLGQETQGSLFISNAAFYAQQRITLHLAEAVTCLWPMEKRIETEKGRSFHYDVLVLATGAKARRLALPGADDPRILTLRNLDDAMALKQRLALKPRLAVIGGGLIGLEVAASARQMGASVHVLEAGERLMARSVPTAISHRMAALHRRHGVMLHFNAQVSAIATSERELLLHTNTERLAADLVVVGIGGIAETSLAEAAGLAVADGVLTEPGRSRSYSRWQWPALSVARRKLMMKCPGTGLISSIGMCKSWGHQRNNCIKSKGKKVNGSPCLPWMMMAPCAAPC